MPIHTTQTTRSHGVNTSPIYLPDWKGRRIMAWVTATLGLLLLTFDGLSMEAVLCCLSAAGLFVMLGLGEETAEDELRGEVGTVREAARSYGGDMRTRARTPTRLDWTVVDGAYLRPRPNRKMEVRGIIE